MDRFQWLYLLFGCNCCKWCWDLLSKLGWLFKYVESTPISVMCHQSYLIGRHCLLLVTCFKYFNLCVFCLACLMKYRLLKRYSSHVDDHDLMCLLSIILSFDHCNLQKLKHLIFVDSFLFCKEPRSPVLFGGNLCDQFYSINQYSMYFFCSVSQNINSMVGKWYSEKWNEENIDIFVNIWIQILKHNRCHLT